MSYRIIFKGRIDEVLLDDYRGKTLAEKWGNDELHGRIEIEGSFYDASAIKSIVKDSTSSRLSKEKEDNMQRLHEDSVKFSIKRAELMQLPVRGRARDFYNVDLARMVWRGVMGYVADEQEIEEILIPKSEEWLKEHPTFHVASPTAYLPTDILQKINSRMVESTDEDAYDIKTLMAVHALQLAQRVLQA